MARRERIVESFAAALLHLNYSHAELSVPTRIGVMSSREETTMRWKISHNDHDPRLVDLLAVIALLVVIGAAYHYFTEVPAGPPHTTAFITPSENVHW
jgi:hypothetical protein